MILRPLIILFAILWRVNGIRQCRQANGCGHERGFKFDSILRKLNMDFTIPCCNEHDICYDRCNQTQIICDNDYRLCVQQACNKPVKTRFRSLFCELYADLLFYIVGFAGTGAFDRAQRKHCLGN
ncbi:unnamed protein product [Adineta steineri]|uniref:Uncharacterized protein n=1 Tax=Adineta steineri TaxID=433720 RepID=A0A814KJH9_9BILA|nr:unnamed protein product [Adineta steineri]CAF1082653.1 unnamed protein product [Adineta steineri]